MNKWEPVCVIPFCRKNQTGGEPLGGNQLILDTKYSNVHKEVKLFIYVSSNQGELCLIDYTLTRAEKVINNNLRDVDFYNHTDEFLVNYDSFMRNLRDT